MNRQSRRTVQTAQRGFILVLTVVILTLTLIIGTSVISTVAVHYSNSQRVSYVQNAVYAADAGISDTIQRLNADSSFTGYTEGTPRTLFDRTAEGQGRATYWTTVAPGASSSERIITSYGKTYGDASDSSLKSKQTVQATVKGDAGTPPPAVPSLAIYAGHGGLGVFDGSYVKGTGDMYVSGTLYLYWIYSQIGSPSAPNKRTITVQGIGCGSGSSYPQQCSGNTAWAEVGGNFNGILCAKGGSYYDSYPYSYLPYPSAACRSDPQPKIASPTFDRAGFIAAQTAASRSGSTACTSAWAAKTTFTSNISINGCTATINGDAYVDGKLTMYNGTIRVAAGITTTPTVVVRSGIDFDNSKVIKNSNGIGVRFISFRSDDPACNSNPSCVDISGSMKKSTIQDNNSETDDEIHIGSSTGTYDYTGSIFWSYFGTIHIYNFPGSLGTLIGQQITFEGSDTNVSMNPVPDPLMNPFNPPPPVEAFKITQYRQIYN